MNCWRSFRAQSLKQLHGQTRADNGSKSLIQSKDELSAINVHHCHLFSVFPLLFRGTLVLVVFALRYPFYFLLVSVQHEWNVFFFNDCSQSIGIVAFCSSPDGGDGGAVQGSETFVVQRGVVGDGSWLGISPPFRFRGYHDWVTSP